MSYSSSCQRERELKYEMATDIEMFTNLSVQKLYASSTLSTT